MQGHSHREGRTMRYDGTRATLIGRYHPTEQEIEIHDHLSGGVETIRPSQRASDATGHGGGDAGLMAAFVRAVRDPQAVVTSARDALESHLMALAAEEARLTGRVVDMARYRQQARRALSNSGRT
jgi:predicted dehydrogenase